MVDVTGVFEGGRTFGMLVEIGMSVIIKVLTALAIKRSKWFSPSQLECTVRSPGEMK